MTRHLALACLFFVGACGDGNSNLHCDNGPDNLAGVCDIASAGQCVDFSGLANSDLRSEMSMCQGTWGGAFSCTTTNRVATCQIPPFSPRSGITCSPNAVILLRYYSSRYTVQQAQVLCASVAGSTFTPG